MPRKSKKKKGSKKKSRLNEYKGYTQLYIKAWTKSRKPFVSHYVKAKNLQEAKKKIDRLNKEWTKNPRGGGKDAIAKTTKVVRVKKRGK